MQTTDELERLILSTIESVVISDTRPWAISNGLDHNAVLGCVNSLTADSYVVTAPLSKEFWELTPEASRYLEMGSPEKQVYGVVLNEGADGADEAFLKSKLGDDLVKIGVGKCMARKWVKRDKASGKFTVLKEKAEEIVDELVEQLRNVAAGKADGEVVLLKDLKSRQLVVLV